MLSLTACDMHCLDSIPAR